MNLELVRRIGWMLVTEMHRDVPESDRPLAWCDLSHEQERRIMCAAALAVRMAEKPREIHTEFVNDRRQARAMAMTAGLMKALEPVLDRDQFREAHRAIFEAVYLDGIEVITEADRVQAGLSPRDQNGLTREELTALDARLLHAMLSPVPTIFAGLEPAVDLGAIPR